MSIYYISAASGDNGNTGLSEALAWATIDHGMNIVTSGDHVYVKNDGNYNELVTIDAYGAPTLPIIFEGYSGVIGDNERATIDAQGVRANCLIDSLANQTPAYYVFKNLRFTDATSICVTVECAALKFKNCRIDNSDSWGLYNYNTVFEDCEFDHNNDGVFYANNHMFLGCKFYNNGNADVNGAIDNVFYGCTFFTAAEYGIYVHTAANCTYVFNCTFDGDSKDTGVAFDCEGGDKQLVSINNLFYDNGVALRHPHGQRCLSRNNLFDSNTTKYQLGANTYTDEINGAPNFVDEGANDYRLDVGSSGIFNGFDFSKVNNFQPGGMDIGAFQVLGSGTIVPFEVMSTSGNLFIGGRDQITDSEDLFVWGKSPANDSINLILTYPSFHIIDLGIFLKVPEPSNDSINLFIKGPEPINSSVGLSIHGDEDFTDSLSLYISAQVSYRMISLFIKAASSEEDTFGITLDQLIKKADYNPQIIGRFTTNPSSVTIEVWEVTSGSILSLSSYDCYEIGDTDRWAWSSIHLPPLTKRVNQYVYRMTANTAETFDGDFIVKTKKIGKERGR